MKKINWKLRFKNPHFVAQVFVSIFVPIFTYFGLEFKDLTTWYSVLELITNALSNPYVLAMIVVSLFNAINDPTTKGVADSDRALNYTEIK